MLDSSSSIPDNILQALLAEQDCVRRLARRLARDTSLAHDIEQETWLAALRNPPQHDGNLRAWLGRLVKFTARSMQRGERRRVVREDAWQRERELEDAEPAERALARAELSRELAIAVTNLREPYRTPILYTIQEDLSSLEIARRLKKPDATVRSHIKRGLEMIRAELEHAHAGEKRGPEHWLSALVLIAREPVRNTGPVPSSRTGDLGRAAATLLAATKSNVGLAALVLLALGVFLWTRGETHDRTLTVDAAPFARQPAIDPVALPARAASSSRDPIASQSPPAASTAATKSESSLRIDVEWEADHAPAAGVNVLVQQWSGFRSFDHEGVTGADGSIVFEHLEPQRAIVLIDRGGGGARVDLEPGREAHAKIAIPPGVSVVGTVVDQELRPIDGAGIYLTYGAGGRENQWVARTDDAGRFAIAAVDPTRAIGARKSGWAPSNNHEVRGRAGDVVNMQLVLPGRGGGARGVVLGPGEKPIARAQVKIGASDRATEAGDRSIRNPCARRLVTDSNGRFEADDLALGENEIRVDAAGFALRRASVSVVAGDSSTVEIRLGRGAGVSGVVRDTRGDRVPNSTLYVQAVGADPISVVSADGTYAIDGLPPGEYEMIARADARGAAREKIELVEGSETSWNPTLQRGLVISGRVVDDADRALADWSVRARPMHDVFDEKDQAAADWLPEWGRTKTDGDGRFTLCNLFAGEWTIDARDARSSARAESVRASPPTENIVIRARLADTATASLRGALEDEKHVPIGEAVVELVPESLALATSRATTDSATGSFEFKPLAAGLYRLRVAVPEFVELRSAPYGMAKGEAKDVGAITLQRAGTVRIRLARTGRGPIGNFVVSLSRDDVVTRPTEPVDGWSKSEVPQIVPVDGESARSRELAPGSYAAVVRAADGRLLGAARRFAIEAGKQTELVIELPPE